MSWSDNPDSFWNNGGSDLAEAGAGALGLILGGGTKDPYKGTVENLNKSYNESSDYSKFLGGQGMDLMSPASQWLKAVVSGDRQALLQATQPERRKVIDQYSTAKKAIGEFAPRGGGQATAMSNLQANEAADLSGVTAGARTAGIGQALTTGIQEQGQSLASQQIGNQALVGMLQALKQQQEQKKDTGSAWGKILGGVLTGLSFLA